jgi:hypothetical protein
MAPLNQEEEQDRHAVRRAERRQHYAHAAAERLQLSTETQFCLLPFEELARTAGLWFDTAQEALMRANYGPLDAFIRQEIEIGARQGFELDDMITLLRLLRQTAIEEEGWNPDMLVEMDDVINEGFAGLRGQVSWEFPPGLNYLTGETAADLEAARAAAEAAEEGKEKRTHSRNKLHLPIRVRAFLPKGAVEEFTRTENVARGGIYFLSELSYYVSVRAHVSYPYWEAPGAINPQYEAEVVRVDETEKEGYQGIAMRFLETLGRPKKRKEEVGS